MCACAAFCSCLPASHRQAQHCLLVQDKYNTQVRMSKLASLFLVRRILQYSQHSDHALVKLDSSIYEVSTTAPTSLLCNAPLTILCSQLHANDDAFTGSMKAIWRTLCRHNGSYYHYTDLRCPARQHKKPTELTVRLAVRTEPQQRQGSPEVPQVTVQSQ